MQLERGGPLRGYFQPVEIHAPEGVMISLASQGDFTEPEEVPVKVGLLIAPVYRLKVTNIPHQEGREVFPTIEMVNRLYPPRGLEDNFPIPIELTEEELNLALEGNFVTRVIYLEDGDKALPIARDDGEQPWMDTGPGANTLKVADELGRPMAILRMGGRLPTESQGIEDGFLLGCAPFTRYAKREQLMEQFLPQDAPPKDAAPQEAVEKRPNRKPSVSTDKNWRAAPRNSSPATTKRRNPIRSASTARRTLNKK